MKNNNNSDRINESGMLRQDSKKRWEKLYNDIKRQGGDIGDKVRRDQKTKEDKEPNCYYMNNPWDGKRHVDTYESFCMKESKENGDSFKIYDINTWKYLLWDGATEKGVGIIKGIDQQMTGSAMTKKEFAEEEKKFNDRQRELGYKEKEIHSNDPDWYKYQDIRFNVQVDENGKTESWHLKKVIPITKKRFLALGGDKILKESHKIPSLEDMYKTKDGCSIDLDDDRWIKGTKEDMLRPMFNNHPNKADRYPIDILTIGKTIKVDGVEGVINSIKNQVLVLDIINKENEHEYKEYDLAKVLKKLKKDDEK